MRTRVLRTERDLSALFLRLALALVLFPYGVETALGWSGGQGYETILRSFQSDPRIPLVFTLFGVAVQLFGSLALFFGFLTRIAAVAVIVEMAAALYFIHLQPALFLNALGRQGGEGVQFYGLVVAIALALLLKGGGLWSIDGALSGRTHKGEIYLPIH